MRHKTSTVVSCVFLFVGVLLAIIYWHLRPTFTNKSIIQGPNADPGSLISYIKASEYHITWNSLLHSYQSPNRAQNLRFLYYDDGFSVQPRKLNNVQSKQWSVTFELSGIKKGNKLYPFNGENLKVFENKSFSETNELVIEFINNKEGMRQNFFLKKRPQGTGQVDLEFNVKTSLNMEVDPQGLSFWDKHLQKIIEYDKLQITDAVNNVIVGWFEKRSNGFAICFNDASAIYPIMVDPLSHVPAWSIEGDPEGSEFGYMVSSSGDVNNDSFNDILISAPFFDNVYENEGKVFLFHGNENGTFSTVPNWTVRGNQKSSRCGLCISYAGDVNGDLFDDIIIGTPYYNKGYNSRGKASIYYGSATGLSVTPSWEIMGSVTDNHLGKSVSGAGDVNGDGIDDVIVSCDGVNSKEGAVYVFHGSREGLLTQPNATLVGDNKNALIGNSIFKAGDINKDGFGDIVVGAATYVSNGAVFVFYGSPQGLTQSNISRIVGEQLDSRFGARVSNAGDVNHDGYDDLIIGAYLFDVDNLIDAGKVYVYHGSSTGISSEPAWIMCGTQEASYLGLGISSAGDINHDGFGDVIIGASYYDSEYLNQGIAYIYTGSETGLASSPYWIQSGNSPEGAFGNYTANAGDINKDGVNDVLIGASRHMVNNKQMGAVFLYYGVDEGLPVQLSSFTADIHDNMVKLSWSTATERNNYGFEVHRKYSNGNWQCIGFVNGSGNSNVEKHYSFIDHPERYTSQITYRLRQIDLDGGSTYSDEVIIDKDAKSGYSLEQGYPNPSNSSSSISYYIPFPSNIKLCIYNIKGEIVNVLSEGRVIPGRYNHHWNSENIPSGVYFCRLEAISLENSERFNRTIKLILLK